MKTQFIFLVLVACLNVTALLVLNISVSGTPIIAGLDYVHPVNGTDYDDFEERFNATDTMDRWSDSPFSGIPLIGDTFSGLSNFFDTFRFLIDGVGTLIEWCGSFIPAGQTVFTYIAWAIRVLTGIMAVTLIVEFISGRELLP